MFNTTCPASNVWQAFIFSIEGIYILINKFYYSLNVYLYFTPLKLFYTRHQSRPVVGHSVVCFAVS